MGPARGATRVLEFVSRSGRIATDQKAVRRRGPGRVVLGSKPQLATTEKNSCAGPGSKPQLATTEKLASCRSAPSATVKPRSHRAGDSHCSARPGLRHGTDRAS